MRRDTKGAEAGKAARAALGAIVLAVLVSGCVPAPTVPSEARLSSLEEEGWQVFLRERCLASCHVLGIVLASPDGARGLVPDLRKTPPRSRDWYLAYLINPQAVLPRSPMPSYGYLSDGEMEALIAFLRRLNAGVTAATERLSEESIVRVAADLDSYNAGRRQYRRYCAGCHGETGNGGGPVGHVLAPEPRDFTDVVWMSKQTDLYLFSVITNGKPNTAMPAFADVLDAQQRALLLRYIRYFADPVARERMELGFVLQ